MSIFDEQAKYDDVLRSIANANEQRRVNPSLEDMLAMRMRWGASNHRFHHLNIKRCGDNVMLWVIMPDAEHTHMVLTDEFGLYPSDTLITKLRMLEDTLPKRDPGEATQAPRSQMQGLQAANLVAGNPPLLPHPNFGSLLGGPIKRY